MTTIRSIKTCELDFLTEMLYESLHFEDETAKPPKEALLKAPHLMKYVNDWGRKGDTALIAFSPDDTPVGAIWYRIYSYEERGYGFVDEETPEISMALIASCRGNGIGTSLLQSIIERAKTEGYKGLSLSVDPSNTAAFKLYEKFGFSKCGEEGTSWTMKLTF